MKTLDLSCPGWGLTDPVNQLGFYQTFLLNGKNKNRTELCVLYDTGKVLKAGNQLKMLENRFSGVDE